MAKDAINAAFFQEIGNFSKTELETIFLNLSYVGQNQDSGLHAKRSGVIFFKPFILDTKHGVHPQFLKPCAILDHN